MSEARLMNRISELEKERDGALAEVADLKE
jgi:hypothetical protein